MSKLELRELKGDDMFSILSIIGKLDITDEFVELFTEESNIEPQDHKDKDPTKAEKERLDKIAEERGIRVGAKLVQKVLKNAKLLKGDLNELLSDLTSENMKVIKDLGMIEYTSLLVDFFKKEELRDLFTSIASLM